MLRLPLAESVWAGQSEHAEELALAENFPSMQGRQGSDNDEVPSVFEYFPGSQAVQTVDATPECVPRGH